MISIAIDGPAGVGKSTLAKEIAKKLKFVYVDTGAFYRAIALFILRNNIDIDNIESIFNNIESIFNNIEIKPKFEAETQKVYLNGEDVTNQIRFEEISMMASKISAIESVRTFLLNLQQDIAKKNNVVMDGRDIGTVVLPTASVKIFLTAKPEIRAQRRYKETIEKGKTADFNEISRNIIKRDKTDSTRKIAPLKPAADAIIVDTSEYNLEESIKSVFNIIIEKIKIDM